MPEWLIGADCKSAALRATQVRILPSPPDARNKNANSSVFFGNVISYTALSTQLCAGYYSHILASLSNQFGNVGAETLQTLRAGS